jgi:hypothetical protein
MKKPPLFQVIARLKPLALDQQIHHLRALVKAEPPHSIRRNELQSILSGKLLKQLKRENKAA